MKEWDEKSEKLSVACQSLEKWRKKVKNLKAPQNSKKEAKKIESKVSAAEEEFTKCADIFLTTKNASNDVEKKKQGLEASLQDLVNYIMFRLALGDVFFYPYTFLFSFLLFCLISWIH